MSLPPERNPAALNTRRTNQRMAAVIELMGVNAAEGGVSLHFTPNPEVGEVVLDGVGIYRCILNLVSNDIDACELKKQSVAGRTRRSVGAMAPWVQL